MPPEPPPTRCPKTPYRHTLPAGTRLWRVHDRKYPPESFRPADLTPSGRFFGGGRFDGTIDAPYPYLYTAPDAATALAETLLRDLPYGGAARRTISRHEVNGRNLSSFELTTDLTLLSLTSVVHLSAVCGDAWLVTCDQPAYAQTRFWAHWLWATRRWAHGLVWTSKRDHPNPSMILFGDRCPAFAGPTLDTVALDDVAGAKFVRDMLRGYNATVRLPRRNPV